MSVEVESTHDSRVETWWLNRVASRNAITLEMWESLRHEAERVRELRHVRVVVVRGRGSNFSAGADITGLGRTLAGDHDGSRYRATNAAAETAIATLPLPTIAAIEGFCVGGGVQLAVACDLRSGHRSSRYAVTPAKLGIAYPASSIRRLVATVGLSAASELLLGAQAIDADAALRVGLITRVVDDLDEGVSSMVTTLLEQSPFTQAATKVVLSHLVEHVDLSEIGRHLEQASLEHGDLEEGLAAFVEKRRPHFNDRPDLPHLRGPDTQ